MSQIKAHLQDFLIQTVEQAAVVSVPQIVVCTAELTLPLWQVFKTFRELCFGLHI